MAQKIYKTPLEQAQADFDSGKISQGQLDDVAIADFEKNRKINNSQKPKLMPRDDAYKQKMAEFHAKRKAMLDSDDDYLGPKWNALSDEIKKFRSGYEPSKIDSPHEYFLNNDLDEFQLDQVRDDISFQQLWDEMQKGNDIYKIASVDGQGFDSDVREKIFSAMADKLGLDYDDIYNTWLGRGKPVKTPSNPRYTVDNGNPNPKPNVKDAQEQVGKWTWNFRDDVKRWLKDSPYDLSDEDIEYIAKRAKVRR